MDGSGRISEAGRYDHTPPDRDEDGRGCAGLARAARRCAAAGRAVGRPGRRRQRGRTPTVVLHADRSRRACPAPAAARPAARGDGTRRRRAFPGRVRHGRHDHGARERAGPPRGLHRPVRPRARPRSRPVLPARLRHPGRHRRLGLPVRRPPRIAQQPRGRRRAGRRHTVLHGRRPGRLTTSRRRAESAAGPGRGPGPRARAVAPAPAPAASGAAAEGATRSRHRQPRRYQRRGPGDPARGHLAGRRFGDDTEQDKLQTGERRHRRRRRDTPTPTTR